MVSSPLSMHFFSTTFSLWWPQPPGWSPIAKSPTRFHHVHPTPCSPRLRWKLSEIGIILRWPPRFMHCRTSRNPVIRLQINRLSKSKRRLSWVSLIIIKVSPWKGLSPFVIQRDSKHEKLSSWPARGKLPCLGKDHLARNSKRPRWAENSPWLTTTKKVGTSIL